MVNNGLIYIVNCVLRVNNGSLFTPRCLALAFLSDPVYVIKADPSQSDVSLGAGIPHIADCDISTHRSLTQEWGVSDNATTKEYNKGPKHSAMAI